MLRTALKPKWLGLLAVLLLVVVAFTWLGLWQLDVARERQFREAAERAASTPVQQVDRVLPPHAPLTADKVGLGVTATGTYDASKQLLITPRQLNGEVGAWVMTPLDTGDAYLPVVRGWVPDPAAVQPPPTGVVTVVGSLAPPESAADEVVDLPEGQASTIDTASLVNHWDGGIYNTFIYLESEADASGQPLAAWTPTAVPAPPPGSGGIQWRNLAYALQWWFFAGFAVYMYWRIVKDDSASDRVRALGGAPATEPGTPEPFAADLPADDSRPAGKHTSTHAGENA